jgi:hypothetical protein
MRRTPQRWRLAAPAALACLVLVVTAGAVAAFNPQPEPPGSFVLGITEGQALSLTAVNLAAGGMCRARLEHKDAHGDTLASEDIRLAPRSFASLDFIAPTINPADPRERLQVRGVVTPLQGNCKLATTLEIFDTASGKTTAAIGEA